MGNAAIDATDVSTAGVSAADVPAADVSAAGFVLTNRGEVLPGVFPRHVRPRQVNPWTLG